MKQLKYLLKIELVGKLKLFLFYFAGLRDSRDRTALYTNGRPGDEFGHFLSLEWIVDPRLIKVKGTLGNTLFAIAVGIYTGVSTVENLEELVLRLVVGAGITDS